MPGVLRGADPRGRARREVLRARPRRPAGAGHRRGPLPGRAGGDPGRRATRTRRGARWRASRSSYEVLAAADRCPRGGLRLHCGPDSPGTATWCATSRSGTATPTMRPPTWWWSASTRSACRTRPSSARSPGWPCRPPTAASTCTSPPSGCTSTGPRSRRASACREEKVRLTLAGVGGAFGAREDLSMQVHACLLALHTGKPVRMSYNREESFFGHVHRHPAWMRYEHGADRDGRLVYVKATIVLDGGAYASTTQAVVGNAASLGVGPVRGAPRRDRRLRRADQQPALRRHARLRRGAGLLRVRVADGRAGGAARASTRSRSGSATPCRRARCCPPAR